MQGFEKALDEHNLAAVVTRFIPPHIDSGAASTLEIMQSTPPPDAILTTNSLILAGALKACRELGLNIPGDVGLAGFYETTWATLVQPSLTVISQPTDEIGRAAMELLLRRLENPDQPYRQVILKGQLIARESTQPKSAISA